MTTVLTTGVFDLLHYGHLSLLLRAKELGDTLTVGVKDDESVREMKGRPPILTLEERMRQLRVLPFVDQCIAYSQSYEAILLVRPTIFVHGDDWFHQMNRDKDLAALAEVGGELHLIPYTPGISDSEIRRRLLHGS